VKLRVFSCLRGEKKIVRDSLNFQSKNFIERQKMKTISRKDFLKISALGLCAVPLGMNDLSAQEKTEATPSSDDGFTLWQLSSQVDTIGNSYVILTNHGKVIVMDGGVKEETLYLRGFLGALGNEVEAWFTSHPHSDHIGAVTEILQNPKDIVIKKLYHSEFSPAYRKTEPQSTAVADLYYESVAKSGVEVVNNTKPGLQITIDGVHFKILTATIETFQTNTYNNASMVVKVWDNHKSAVFLGDLGAEGGDLLLDGQFGKELDCDYLQMAHHGQRGVNERFYRSVKFTACLWPSPSWVYNATPEGNLETYKTRNLMKELGITKHYISFHGLSKIR
jgi:glyoxylase-like metal-dependent hydrolase (beta-lactamase superfamily II)